MVPLHALLLLGFGTGMVLAATITPASLISYMGGTVTGQALLAAPFSFIMISNTTHILVSITASTVGMSKAGWFGFGFGEVMDDSDMVVLWPNSDASWTLSHRSTTGNVMPTLTTSATTASKGTDSSGELAVVTSLSSSSAFDTSTTVTFTRPLAPGSSYVTTQTKFDVLKQAINQPVIYAYGDTNPGNSAQSTTIAAHQLDNMGSTFVDLSSKFTATEATVSAPFESLSAPAATGASGESANGTSSGTTSAAAVVGASSRAGTAQSAVATASATSATSAGGVVSTPTGDVAGSSTSAAATAATTSTTGSASSSTTSSSSTSSYMTLLMYHGICGALAWLLCAPTAVLAARLFRSCTWMPTHWGVQVFATTPLTTVGVGLASYAVHLEGGTTTWDTHQILGFTLFSILILQELVGLWIHLAGMARTKAEKKEGRPIKNWFHMGFGLVVVITGFLQVRLGLSEYGVTDAVYLDGYWVPVVLFVVLYLGSAILAIVSPPPPAKKHHHKKLHKKHHHHHHKPKHHHEAKHYKPKHRKKHKHHQKVTSSSSSSGNSSDASSSSSSSTSSDSSSKKKKHEPKKAAKGGKQKSDSSSSASSSGSSSASSMSDSDATLVRKKKTGGKKKGEGTGKGGTGKGGGKKKKAVSSSSSSGSSSSSSSGSSSDDEEKKVGKRKRAKAKG